MTAWISVPRLDQASFAKIFLDRVPDDPMAMKLRAAARGVSLAQSQSELADAATDLAAAMQMAGPDRWRSVLADAQQRADSPAAGAAIASNRLPPAPSTSRIKPVIVGPVESVLVGGAIAGTIAKEGVLAGIAAIAKKVAGEGASKLNAASPEIRVIAVPEVEGILPNARNAFISPVKFDYFLNPAHVRGGNKARVFESALGFAKENASELVAQIKAGVTKIPATIRELDKHGQRYSVDIPVIGPKGGRVVTTGWIVDPGKDIPRLVTAFIK